MAAHKKSSLFETVKTLVYAIIIALGIRTIAFEPFNIPSGSMIPTLLVGDYLFVAKFSYGYSRHSLPLSQPAFAGRVMFHEPDRGDVVVFKLPRDHKTDYIKRIVGLPGDTIQVREGSLYINGEMVKRERIEDYVERDRFGNETRIPQYIETLPNGRTHRIVELSDFGSLDNTMVYTVPEGHYFAMGDNRDNSLDSRMPTAVGVGFVPAENLVGRAEVLFLSVNGNAQLWEVWRWFDGIRFSRLLRSIE